MVKTEKTIYPTLFLIAALGVCLTLGTVGALGAEAQAELSGDALIAGGMTFGMKIGVDGAVVVDVGKVGGTSKSPAADAGLKRGDIITKADGAAVYDTHDLIEAIENGGDKVTLSLVRGGKEITATVRPEKDEDGNRRIGVLIRDSAAGIGTVTYIDPDTLTFAGLGHGICDAESGTLLPIAHGSVEEITVTGINQGKTGSPGEIRGSFSGRRIGKILKNSETGVYGVLTQLPSDSDALYDVAEADEVRDGTAYIRSTVGGKAELYEIKITKIGDGGQKNFAVKVTDERLIDLTGGIVQGMSGSPIIQSGKLVGAITHVLVGDPTAGYGIFIGNMLGASQTAEFYEDSAA